MNERYQKAIDRALSKADLVKDDEIGFVAVEAGDGMIIKVWYRTIGDENVVKTTRVITAEKWDWEKAGCKNNREWRRYLNKNLWRDYSCGYYGK